MSPFFIDIVIDVALSSIKVVDMRWGVRDESADDHSTLELCLKEIRACQELSTGPNFMVSVVKLSWFPFSTLIDYLNEYKVQLDSEWEI